MGAIKTVTEWRVTGDPTTMVVHPSGQSFPMNFPPYHFVWYSDQQYDASSRPIRGNPSPLSFSAEEAAKHFMAISRNWKDGPHLHWRTVTYTDWNEVNDPV